MIAQQNFFAIFLIFPVVIQSVLIPLLPEFSSNNFTISDTLNWSLGGNLSVPTSTTSSCAGMTIFGGYCIFGGLFWNQVQQTVEAPAFWSIQMSLDFVKIDDWGTAYFWINITNVQNSQLITIYSQNDWSGSTENLCGVQREFDEIESININKTTSGFSSFNLLLASDSQPNLFNYWGFQNFSLVIDTCDATCRSCSGPSTSNCLSCQGVLFLYQSKCLTNCPSGYYSNPSNNNCEICNDPHCTDCSSNKSICSQCSSNYLIYQGGCYAQCNSNNYFNISVLQCLLCNETCKTCTGSDGNSCSSCLAPLYLLNNATCVTTCPSGTYHNDSLLICGRCDATCASCSGPLSTQCMSCSSPYFYYFWTCILSCPDGYYNSLTYRSCQVCDISCNTCNGPWNTSCTSCFQKSVYAVYFLQVNTCVMECGDGYYTNLTDYTCFKCDSGCETCRGQTLTDCLTCRTSDYFYNYQCWMSCPPGTYAGLSLPLLCQSCSQACSTCSSGTANDCIYCSVGYFRNGSSCVASCPGGYYGNVVTIPNQCSPCNLACLNCSGPSANECTSCPTLKYLENTTCVTSCSFLYYKYDPTMQCLICPLKCQQCSGGMPTDCLSCNTPAFLFLQNCMFSCPSGFYGDSVLNQCLNCTNNCLTCKGPLLTDCQSCLSGFYLTNGQCLRGCNSNQYLNLTNDECGNCLASCLTCINALDNCTSCLSEYFYYKNSCYISCPTGTYPDNSTGIAQCLNCSLTCMTCFEKYSYSCSSCYPGMYFQENTCVVMCGNGFYLDSTSANCYRCNPTCSLCNGPGDSDCLACYSENILLGATCTNACDANTKANLTTMVCEPCQSNCQDNCSISCCNSSQPYYYLTQCLETCPNGTYPSGTTCAQCNGSCSSCDASNCYQCIPPSILSSGTCLSQCQNGTFRDVNSNICINCSSCNTCNGPTAYNCLSCPNNFLIFNSTCYSQCPFTSFLNSSGLCEACDSSCLNCSSTSPNFCIQCPFNSYLYHGSCLGQCPDGFYSNNQICYVCNTTCETCDGPQPFDCKTCYSPYYYFLGNCINNCPISTYADNETNNCTYCDESCATCIGELSTNCSSCDGQLLLLVNECIISCPEGYYENWISNQCSSCDSSCLSCFGPENSNCLSCPSNRYYQLAGCVLNCSSGFYLDPLLPSNCSACYSGCASCSGPSSNQCFSCGDGYYYYNYYCYKTCPNGYYNNGTTRQCELCNPACTICSDQSQTKCTNCSSGNFLVLQTCNSTCPSYFYADPASGLCLRCYLICPSCFGNSSDNCSSCDSPYFLNWNNCVESCPASYYGDDLTRSCKECNSSCNSCYGPNITQCYSCENNFYLYETNCLTDCPGGRYGDNNTNACLLCYGSCGNCSGSSNMSCTSCENPLFLYNNECNSICQDGFYGNSSLNSCQTCDSSCVKCFEYGSMGCTLCNNSLFLNPLNNSCGIACPNETFANNMTRKCDQCDSTCYNCDGPSSQNCTNCQPNLEMTVNNSCIPCPDGFYFENSTKTCNKCNNFCQTCFNYTYESCISCPFPNVLLGTTCVSSCPSYYFLDASISTCFPCDISCGTCFGTSSQNCSSCETNNWLDNFTASISTCFPCDVSCETCFGNSSQNCSSCKTNDWLYNFQCISSCPAVTFANSTEMSCYLCTSLFPNCDSCSSVTCLHCEAGFFLYHGICVEFCPISTVLDPTNNYCLDCGANCLSCPVTNISECSSCLDPFFLNVFQGTCGSNCPNGTYQDVIMKACNPCSYECGTCSNITQCLTCREDYYWYEDTCVSNCSEFDEYGYNDSCVKCYEGCLSCMGTGFNQCLSCNDSFLLNADGSCLSFCLDGSYANLTENKCVSCGENCQTCKNFLCVQCLDGFYLENEICSAKQNVSFVLNPINNPFYFEILMSFAGDSQFFSSLTQELNVSIDNLSFQKYSFNVLQLENSNESFGVLFTFTSNVSIPIEDKLSIIIPKTLINASKYLVQTYDYTLNTSLQQAIYCQDANYYYDQSSNTCMKKHVVAFELTLSSDSNVIFCDFQESFSSLPDLISNYSTISLTSDQNAVNLTLSQSTNQQFLIEIINNKTISDRPYLIFSLIIPAFAVELEHLIIENTEDTVQIYDLSDLSQDEVQKIQNSVQALQANNFATTSAVGAVNSFSGGSFFMTKGLMLLETMMLIKYIDLDYPQNLRNIFQDSSNSRLLFQYIYNDEIQDEKILPKLYVEYGVSPFIWNNLGESLARLTLAWGISFIIYLTNFFRFTRNNKIFKLIRGTVVWQIPLLLFFTYFEQVALNSFLVCKYNYYYSDDIKLVNALSSSIIIVVSFSIFLHFHAVIETCHDLKPSTQLDKPITDNSNMNKDKEDLSAISKTSSRSIKINQIYPDSGNIKLNKNKDSMIVEECGEESLANKKQGNNGNIKMDDESLHISQMIVDRNTNLDHGFMFESFGVGSSKSPPLDKNEDKKDFNDLNTISSPGFKFRKSDSTAAHNLSQQILLTNMTNKSSDHKMKKTQISLESEEESSPKKAHFPDFLGVFRRIFRRFYIVKPDQKEEYLAKYGFLHLNSKDENFWTRQFIMLDLYRQMAWCMIVVFLNDFPFLQIIFFCLIHALYFYLFFMVRPLNNHILILMLVFNEMAAGVAFFSAMVIGIYDNQSGNYIEKKEMLGWVVIYAKLTLLYGLIFFTVVKLIFKIIGSLKGKRGILARISEILKSKPNKKVNPL